MFCCKCKRKLTCGLLEELQYFSLIHLSSKFIPKLILKKSKLQYKRIVKDDSGSSLKILYFQTQTQEFSNLQNGQNLYLQPCRLYYLSWFTTLERKVFLFLFCFFNNLGPVKRIWYLSPMRAAKVQASLRIRAVSPEPPLLAHTSSESRGTFRQKATSLAPLNGWACAVKICHDGILEDTNSLDGAQLSLVLDNNIPANWRVHLNYYFSWQEGFLSKIQVRIYYLEQ